MVGIGVVDDFGVFLVLFVFLGGIGRLLELVIGVVGMDYGVFRWV